VEQGLRRCCPGAGQDARIGAIVFIHRFGALLNPHVHFHCVVVEGVFEADAAGGAQFHEARTLCPEALAEIQARVRTRLLRALSRRNLLEREDAQARGEKWLGLLGQNFRFLKWSPCRLRLSTVPSPAH
jgi:hypothetical protein